MDARLVTVAREISSLNANIIRSRLEAEGVQCFVSGEAASSVVGLPANVGAFIDVQVLDFDAARAQSILQEIEETSRNEDDYDYSESEKKRVASVLRVSFFILIFLTSSACTYIASKNLLGVLLAGLMAVAIAIFLSILLTSFLGHFICEHDYDN